MKEFQKKLRKKNIFHTPLMLVIFMGILLFFLWNIGSLIHKNRETALNRERASLEQEKLLAQKESISKDADRLDSERGTEDVIREKFSVVKQGEGLVVVVDDTKKAETKSAQKTGISGFFQRLFGKSDTK